MTTATIRTLACSTLLTLCLAAHGDAGQIVTVTLTDGQQYTAEISERSSEDRLWLVFRTQSARLLRPIRWEHVASARVGQQQLTATGLQQFVADVENITVESDVTANTSQPHSPLSHAELALAAIRNAPQVANVRFDVFAADWDADPELDGLIVNIHPITDHGYATPVNGTLRVEMISAAKAAFQDVPTRGGVKFDRTGRWVQQVNVAQFSEKGAWFRLSFGSQHPEFDTELAAQAVVNVKLVVPGSGVFESTIDGVRVRPFAPTRDALQRQTGERFFAIERTGRNQ